MPFLITLFLSICVTAKSQSLAYGAAFFWITFILLLTESHAEDIKNHLKK